MEKQDEEPVENPFIDDEYKRRLEPPVYVVVRPIEYGGVRREAGEEASDIPEQSIPWLLEQGHIRRKEGV